MLKAAFVFSIFCVALPAVLGNVWSVSFPTKESCNVVSPTYKGRTRYTGSYKTCNLQITNIRSTDSGLYCFRFETDRWQGKWTSANAATLSITELQVDVHPARTENRFASGETVYLRCTARGCAAPGKTFALYRNGLNLGPANNWFMINNFDPQLAGTFTCRIPSQRIQSPGVTLAVGHAPRSTSVTVSQSGAIMAGRSVTLTCSSSADPPVESYAWFKDQESSSVPHSFQPQLRLWKAGPSDFGLYHCVARNSLGFERSKPVLLNVTYAPTGTQVLISPGGDITEGCSVTLTCRSNANPAVDRYAWYQTAGARSWSRGTMQNLSFPSIRAHQGGQYYCTAWSPLGQEPSSPVLLPVLYAPRNTSVSARPSSEIDAGTSVTLICSSSANPAVENYTWFRVDDAEAWVTRSGPSYTIAEVSPREGGRYFCEARNRIGTHSSPVLTVRVRGRLKVIALASAVGVSASLITLTVMVMISKNMHRVDTETVEEDKEVELMHRRSSSSGDTLFLETLQETFQVRPTKMTDIPEEPEDVYENVHPCIVPMKDVSHDPEADSPLNYITVHFSQRPSQGQDPATNTPPDRANEPRNASDVIYTPVARRNHL
ncbi:hypothetical protein COCON_G00002850 [Conger conger]|uniref:B-cell receptor CD22 n=1 Tax=Conger conger TaxID=82655 RepID=A0A9Q1I8A3_CONCO|nr:hypothetical protein COCON_G00002850 [Conger conger]